MNGFLFDLHQRRRYNNYVVAGVAVLALLSAAVLLALIPAARERVFAESGRSVLVIDPGHGGVDSGAFGPDGTKESDINLSIALRLRALCELYGQETVMTRTEDVSLSPPEKYSEHQDLVRRTELASHTPGGVLISIHQNCYKSPVAFGSQVLYAHNEKSELLGKRINENFRRYLETENRRVAEPAPEKLYLTANAACPAVLAECGFMSNPDDLEKLKSAEYQTGIAAVLLLSYIEYTDICT